MSEYERPYFEEYCSAKSRKSKPVYPYSASVLKKYDALEVYPLDGGGFFYTQEVTGGLKNKQFIDALESGKMLRPWKHFSKGPNTGENMDWLACYDEDKPAGYKDQIVEQHVWIHRWYFMLPLAQEYFRTGKKKYLKSWFSFFNNWHETFADHGPLEDMRAGKKRIMSDMQSVWRMMVMIHSVSMFASRKDSLKKEEWVAIYRSIESHAKQTCIEGLKQKARGGGLNHYLHKGVALVYVGTLFPEFEDSDKWVELGSHIVGWYADKKIYGDGGSCEACPSYSHFITRLFLDAYLLIKGNKRPQVKGLRQSISAQYQFLADTATPELKTLAWGDSYSLDVKRDLEVVKAVFPFKMPARKKSIVYPISQVAILRDKDTVVYVDAMPGGLWHIHRGKPHIEVFYKGKPVLIDRGCVNYDKEKEREGFLKTRSAHNVVTAEPVTMDEWPGLFTKYSMGKLKGNEKSVTAKCVHKDQYQEYSWTRTIILDKNTVSIVDKLKSPREKEYVLHFQLPESIAEPGEGGFCAKTDNWTLNCESEDGQGKKLDSALKRYLAFDDENERVKTPSLSFKQSGKEATFKTLLRISK